MCLKPVSGVFEAAAGSLKDSGRHLSPEHFDSAAAVRAAPGAPDVTPVT